MNLSLNQNPTVSVILPVLNGEPFVQEAIDSLLSQSIKSFEIIVIDDGSTDKSPDIVADFKDPRVLLMRHSSPKGISASLNTGLRVANGKYIARLDSDDLAHSRRLELQVKFLEENPSHGIVGSWMRSFGQRNRAIRYPISDAEVRSVMLFRSPFGHPAVMFRKDWNQGKPGFYDETLETAQDYDYWERMSRHWKCANLPNFLTCYRVHPGQATSRNSDLRREIEKAIILRQTVRLGIESWDAQRTFTSKWCWGRELCDEKVTQPTFSHRALLREKASVLFRPAILWIITALRVMRLAGIAFRTKDVIVGAVTTLATAREPGTSKVTQHNHL